MDDRSEQWDYRVEDLHFKGPDRAALLSERGDDGWELCAMSDNGGWNFTMVFKRPRPDVQSRPREEVSD
jgi:hypothetical protein